MVSNVTFTPTQGVPGQNIAVNYQVNNQGTVSAGGSWTDSVYLSTDGTLSPDDLLLGRVPHTGGLASLAAYTETLNASLPGVVDRSYDIIVVADSGLQVPDVDRANNTGVTASGLPIRSPALTFGTPTTGSVSNGEDLYFKLSVPAMTDVKLSAMYSAAVEAQLFIKLSSIPTTNSFDAATTDLNNLNPSLLLPAGSGGTYYVWMHGREGAGSGQSFTLQANSAPFEVDSFDTPSGGNTGQVTMNLTGAGFTTQTVVNLEQNGKVVVADKTVGFTDSEHLTATFDLNGQSPGTYQVVATDTGRNATAPGAFTIDPGTPGGEGDPFLNINAPAEVQAHSPVPVVFTYGNTGDNDAPADPLQLAVFNGTSINGDYVVNQIDQGTGNGVLAPHSSKTLGTAYYPIDPNPNTEVDIQASTDWDVVKEQLRPSFIAEDAWDAIWGNLTAAVGDDLSGLQSALQADQAYLSQLGVSVSDPEALVSYEIAKANDAIPARVLTTSTDAEVATPGLSLEVDRVYLEPISSRYYLGPFGRGWAFNWDISATTDSQGNVTILEGGVAREFELQSNGTYQGAPSEYGVLSLVNGAYQLREQDGTLLAFNTDGTLHYEQDSAGNSITAGYNSAGQMISLTDSNGAFLSLSYNAQGRISQITDPANNATRYSYDASGEHLLSVTGPSGTVSYTYVTGQGAASEHALASITSTDGSHLYYAYDDQGRLVSMSSDDNTTVTTFKYLSPGGYTETDGDNNTTTILTDANGSPVEVKDTLGHVYHFTYDANGNVVGTTDSSSTIPRAPIHPRAT